MWAEFEQVFSQLSGLYIRICDSEGKSLTNREEEPPFCSVLARSRIGRRACREDCHRQVQSIDRSHDLIANRCHAGLSYRIVPIRLQKDLWIYVVLGKVVTDVFGSQQLEDFAKRYNLGFKELERSLARMRLMSDNELDELARFARRFARYLLALRRRSAGRDLMPQFLQKVFFFTRKLLTAGGGGPGTLDEALESLASSLGVRAAAVLGGPALKNLEGLPAGYSIEEDALTRLAGHDWYAKGAGIATRLFTLPDAVFDGMNLPPLPKPVTAGRLEKDGEDLGRLLLFGLRDGADETPLLNFSLDMLSAKLHSLALERAKEQEKRELYLLDKLGRVIFTAPSVDVILPKALETAMESMQAHRGSIFLAEGEENRITGCALRGEHASLSGQIRTLAPESVTCKVFTEARPIIVNDASLVTAGTGNRQFPYRSRSFVSVPIRDNGHALGVLHLTERERDGSFSEADLALLERLSLQTSVAIQRARLKTAVGDLQLQAMTDPLTKTYNRRHLEDMLPREMQRATRFKYELSLAFVDVDNFKVFNDALGHRAGDVILREMSACISDTVRSVDSIFRYGGEEFVVILPETGLQGALKVIEKVRASAEATIFGDEDMVADRKLTVSAGVAVFPEMALTPEDLVDRADQAQREAKKLGKNRVVPWSHRSISGL